jgi:hypothetical protein
VAQLLSRSGRDLDERATGSARQDQGKSGSERSTVP